MFFKKQLILSVFFFLACNSEINSKEETFLHHFQNEKNIKVKPFDALIPLKGITRESFKKNYSDYSKLLTYYKSNLKAFSEEYGNLFAINYTPLGTFTGNINFDWPEIHMLPVLPVTPVFFDEQNLKFEKLEIEYNSKTVFGLRLTTLINPNYKAWGGDFLKTDMSYLPSVNGKILGLKLGRIIRELSKNIRGSEKYFYNGLRDWSNHSKNKKDDQFEKPLELSNFMHVAGENKYVVSADPDFALEFINYPLTSFNNAVITFFFWNKQPITQDDPPGFVFQVIFNG